MVIELPERNYKLLRSLYGGLDFNLVVDSVIDGNAPALVYCDDIFFPRHSLLWNLYYMLLLVGKPNNENFNNSMVEMIRERIIPEAREKYINHLYFIYHPYQWKNKIIELFSDLKVEKARRRFYSAADVKFDWRTRMPSFCQMVRIDHEILNDKKLIYKEHMINWIISFWKSTDYFLKKGFGYCLIERGRVANWCVTIYVSKKKNYEFGIVTMPASQKKGYATLTAAACLEHCEKHDYTPFWHCWDDNYPSISVAEKVGFKMPFFYDVLKLHLPDKKPGEKKSSSKK